MARIYILGGPFKHLVKAAVEHLFGNFQLAAFRIGTADGLVLGLLRHLSLDRLKNAILHLLEVHLLKHVGPD